MATTPPVPDEPSATVRMAASATDVDTQNNDPFRSVGPAHHRFSNFNSQLFSLGLNASPAHTKRVLEAHLAETDQRMEEAGKLGTALVQQRNELTERLKEVEKLQAEGELSDDLRQKLVEIEKDYNEVARESARAFLPKSRVPSNEAGVGSPFVPEGKGGKRSVSPSKFEAQATGSPTKLSVPNRKIRNQPANRTHDLEFAAELTTSLIAQVRNLQGLLAEKDEELKDIRLDNSKLEYEAEGFQQRLKNLDDNEHRYKDENWSLETQVHDLMAKEKEAADRNKKLTQTINILQAEKNSAQRELDEIKLSHSKLAEEHAAVVKHHDIELGTAKRTMVMGESERAAMQRKIEDLTGQNQELAKAVAASVRGRKLERESILGMSDEDFQTAHDNTTPEQSPPPSPVKGTPRHSMLESETLKTSLAHAQRTIQSLRTNVHREKTERMETKKLLQEARDELERLRSDTLAPNRRARKIDSKEFKKPPRLLGGLRSARSEIFADDPNWEDRAEASFHTRSSPVSRETTIFDPVPEHTDHFETANETSDAAFETANENATETDDFHTGAEEFSSDDVETETDSPSKRRTLTGRPPNLFGQRSMSVHSTASTEDEDFPYDNDSRTPTSLPPLQAKFPLRVSRGAFRRSRHASEEPMFQSSPASFANSSNMSTPQQPAQSLAAELGDFDGSDNESNMSATPSRRSTRVRAMTPPPAMPPLPRVIMVDCGTMTEPLHELPPMTPTSIVAPDRPVSMDTVMSRFSMGSNYSDSGTQDLGEKLAEFPSPPTSPPKRDFPSSLELALSAVHSHHVEPLPEPDTHGVEMAALHREHAEQLKNLTAENALARAAAVEALKSEHADELSRAAAAAKLAHAHELATLRSDHLDATNRRMTEIQTAHARAIESLESGHAGELEEAAAVAEAENVRAHELWENKYNLLKTTHIQELAQKETELKEAYSADMEALKVAHAEEISRIESESKSAHNAEREALRAAHVEHLSQKESESKAIYDADLEGLKAAHAEELLRKESESKAAHTADLEVLKAAHAEELSRKESENIAAHAADLEALKAAHAEELAQKESESMAAHDAGLEALKIAHAEELSQKEAGLKATASTELEALKVHHAEELSKFKSENEAVHAVELAALVEAHTKHVDTTKKELSDAHARALENLKSSHADQIDQAKQSIGAEHSEQLEALKASHLQQIDEVKNSINATHSEELESLRAAHAQQLVDVKDDITAAHAATIDALTNSHNQQLDDTKKSLHAVHSQELESLRAAHTKQQEELGREKDAAHAVAIAALIDSHNKQIDEIKGSMSTIHAQELESLGASHAKQQEDLRKERDAAHATAIAAMVESHTKQLETLKAEGEAVMSREIVAVKNMHAQEIEMLNGQHAAAHAKELDGFKAALAKQVESSKAEGNAAHSQQIEALNAAHTEIIEAHKRDTDSAHSQVLEALKLSHERQIDTLKSEHTAARTKELEAVTAKHLDKLKDLRAENAAARTQALEELTNKHLDELKASKAGHEVSKSQLLEELASTHLKELEALQASLTVVQPTLGYSSMSSVQIEPIELPEIKGPRREAFISPQDRESVAPYASSNGGLIIAEDDTRQSPSATSRSETPDSQQPLKEITANTDARSLRKLPTETSHQGSQTMLTAEGLDKLMRKQQWQPQDSAAIAMDRGEGAITPVDEASAGSPSTVRIRRLSTDSLGSVARARHRMSEGGSVVAPESIPARRPGSSASGRTAAQNRPPLPPNHREVIEAARTNSAHGGKGTMAPPLLPASAYRPSSSRPQTPSNRPLSPTSIKGTLTPRAGRTPGYVDMHSPTRIPMRSRQSSMSSFASEIDTRFNISNGMGVEAAGLGPSTDPRMIQAVTQTMIGEYLWKYTRKAGRGEMSENRHRRFFWVHPYTRALYWSDGDPATASRSEMKAKSVPIEAVRVVADDNPMPPGLHRKSLVVIAPGRTVKFTCTTGQRHETWFNALSYLLLRSGNEDKQDTESMAGNITQDDVDEFNPSIQRRPANGQRPQPPPSLSSYNSRTTRNDSPSLDATMGIPTLTPTHEKEAARSGTLGRLSGYWRSSTLGRGTFSSLRSRGHQPYDSAIYEASEVNDSAEDLRQMIEQQDRESDRLENVRACCDGKHDVGTLPRTTKRGRLSNIHTQPHTHTHPGHPGPSTSQTAMSSTRTRA
ncbi:hypothetical protein HD806DRAFT_303906 [Xylariaceae sp. AK1471]|nr:hypothetical protein HD806DRAFT_303906 [Xylariaceae sp. AK1471]